ncbi:MAG TPA: glycine cleavage system protein H [Syntrophobacteraceae bacterium]|nr:glycine cleavage system protein H [Syntrophobacteraceae bacterium]
MEKIMSIPRSMSIPDRLASLVIALALFVVGAGFMVLGITFLPVVGILVGIPALGLAFHFLSQKAIVKERIAGFVVANDVMFHAGHGWARMGRKEIVTVGMDDFAVKLLGGVDSISLPAIGSKVKQGSFGWLMKADSKSIPMLSPVDGEVVEVNRDVVDSPSLAFDDPYGNGWLFKVRNSNLSAESENMIPTGMIGKWLEDIREALSCRQPAMAAGFLQDGGEPVRGFARVIDPQSWDDLAREFLLTK